MKNLERAPSPEPIPRPPVIYEPTVRLVYSELGLSELFIRTATKNGMSAELVHPEQLAGNVGNHLRSIGAKNFMLARSKMLVQLQLADRLAEQGFEILEEKRDPTDIRDMVLATECFAAVAETGSIVFRSLLGFSLASQLIVIVEPRKFAADLIDLFDLVSDKPTDLVILSGTKHIHVFVLN